MLLTFLTGAVALIVWLYLTSGDRIARGLMQSGLVYVLLATLASAPLIFFTTTGDWSVIAAFVLLAPLIEEGLKSHAARSQRVPIQCFALVSLFGIYELMLSKPFMMSGFVGVGSAPVLETLEALPSVTMHTLTAAVYAFTLKDKRWLQLPVCVVIHVLWNTVSFFGSIYLLVAFSLVAVLWTAWLFPWNDYAKRGQWGSA